MCGFEKNILPPDLKMGSRVRGSVGKITHMWSQLKS